MKTFRMYRKSVPPTHDHNQANPPDLAQFEGVIFSDGRVAVRWLTTKASVSIWDSFEDLLAIHGHPEYDSYLIWDGREESPIGSTQVVIPLGAS